MQDLSLQYAPMQRSEKGACVDLAVHSFADYEYFTNYFPEESQRIEFLRRAIGSEYSTTLGKAHFLCAYHNQKLVAVAQLFHPEYRKPSSFRYLTHGWARVLTLPNRDAVNAWMKMDEEAGSYCHSLMHEGKWYLSSLTVDTHHKGCGIGTMMLKEGIRKYVLDHGGTELCLFTNSESNLQFYQHQGYQLVDEKQFHYNGKTMGSWSLTKKL